MVLRRSDNLRSGHRAEDLAMVLLRQIGAVAQIPSSEDVGCDGIVTLLPRNDADTRMLSASHSFWIQIKKSSVTSVAYNHEEAKWLRDLELPLFFGRMNSAETRIEIFSPYLLWDLYSIGQCHSNPSSVPETKMTLFFQREEEEPAWGYLGPPILAWRFSDFEDTENREARENGVAVMAAWCEGWHRNRLLWPVNVDLRPRYETNKVPSRWSRAARTSNAPEDLSRIAAISIQHIEALLGGLLLSGDNETPRVLLRALRAIHEQHPSPELERGLKGIDRHIELRRIKAGEED